ncbi:hypothetical protein NIES2100_69940 [Calothrix sp. NIES-2100]|nr:hypothetical protein NIES2100_69940 [Calothrix sp. NIES-2100]
MTLVENVQLLKLSNLIYPQKNTQAPMKLAPIVEDLDNKSYKTYKYLSNFRSM